MYGEKGERMSQSARGSMGNSYLLSHTDARESLFSHFSHKEVDFLK